MLCDAVAALQQVNEISILSPRAGLKLNVSQLSLLMLTVHICAIYYNYVILRKNVLSIKP